MPPPPQRPDGRAVGGLYAAIRGVFATLLAAVVFGFAFAAAIPAAGADWVNESAATTGQTGSWSEGVAYDPATQTADICGEAVFTPKAASAGDFVTLKFTTTLYAEKKDGALDADTQGALRIGPKGGFQVWIQAGWLDVAASGVAPVSGVEYGITFVFDYVARRYSVSVKDAKGAWRQMRSAGGAQTFPMAAKGDRVNSITIDGETQFRSLEGSYTSDGLSRADDPNRNRMRTIEQSFDANRISARSIEQSFVLVRNRMGTIEQSFDANRNQTGSNERRLMPLGYGWSQSKGLLSRTKIKRSKKWVQN